LDKAIKEQDQDTPLINSASKALKEYIDEVNIDNEDAATA
jgi:hypothetical protein